MSEVVLSTSGITKHFGALKANEDVSIELNTGEIHAVIGPNGAGKTTLISQICGTLRPDTGTVNLYGADITSHNARARVQMGLGRTFQISALALEDTVLQNACLGAVGAFGTPWQLFRPALCDRKLRDIAEAALVRVGLGDQLNVRTAELSHGQKRQLEVAVALTLKPKVFIMDEPMAGLGMEGSKKLTPLLDELRHEAPILLVEHDMDAVFSLADRISVLVYGSVIATGTVEEIRSNPKVQEAYLGDSA